MNGGVPYSVVYVSRFTVSLSSGRPSQQLLRNLSLDADVRCFPLIRNSLGFIFHHAAPMAYVPHNRKQIGWFCEPGGLQEI
jgi:hypothetical protein